jgi:hypothetical protein
MTLTEFLLARIAEDEEVALSAIRQRDDEIAGGAYVAGSEPQPDADQPVVWDDWTGGPGIRMGAERLLAECEAKRRIVEAWPDTFGLWSADQADAARAMKDVALRALAQPYADHPDYRPEWRA